MRVLTGIYQILNLVTGKFYIGKSLNIYKRWYNHQSELRRNISKSPYLQSAWNKYGEDAFEFIIIELCEPQKIVEKEQYWIDKLGACDRELGYNINPISETSLGAKRTQQTKDRISAANKGNKWTNEAKAKITGRKLTKEHIEKVINTKRKNGTLSSPRLSKALKGNSRRREEKKWPHAWGCKCPCNECKYKRNEYVKNRNKLKEVGLWEIRELSYIRRKVS